MKSGKVESMGGGRGRGGGRGGGGEDGGKRGGQGSHNSVTEGRKHFLVFFRSRKPAKKNTRKKEKRK